MLRKRSAPVQTTSFRSVCKRHARDPDDLPRGRRGNLQPLGVQCDFERRKSLGSYAWGGGDVWRFAAQDQSNQCMDQRQYDRTDGVTRLLATDDKFLRRWTKQVMLNELKGNSSSITSMMLP